MSCTSTFREDINAIEVVYSGQVTIEEVHEAFKNAVALSYHHQVMLFLIDCSDLQPVGSMFNIYELASVLEKIPNVRQLKGSIILPLQQQSAEELKFFETTAKNRGLHVHVFPSREDAIKWLAE